jgi:hypothetical protein
MSQTLCISVTTDTVDTAESNLGLLAALSWTKKKRLQNGKAVTFRIKTVSRMSN